MNKVISAGILLESNNKFLLGHPTELTGTTHGWGILKGKLDEDELLYEAALREFKEESGYDIEEAKNIGFVDVSPRPFFKYDVGNNKSVYVYWAVDLIGYVDKLEFHCPSLVPNTDQPEIDKYQWVNIDEAIELATESQKDLFRHVKELIK